ncbi:MAG TPA: TIGR02466 family protein [Hyphomicrobiaceae bacterium]|nr:TIGR02466 family protein [Hyphomicrobiaceae bacterium]
MSTDTLARPLVSNTVIASHFPTLFMMREFSQCAGLNGLLERLMLRLEKETANIAAATSNIGGYHSDTTLFSRKEPEIGALRELVQAALHEYVPKFLEANCHVPPTKLNLRLWAWGINMRAGDINFQHVHPDAKVSGVYYVSVPPPPPEAKAEEGAIMFVDPRPRAHMNRVQNQTTEITVTPKPGMMVLFPAYYEHAVIPFRGAGVRTCIAFNANF